MRKRKVAMTIELAPMIVADKHTLAGKPRIKGTRISVELILDRLAAGWTADDIIASYPHLTKEGINACLVYAKGLVTEETMLFSHVKAAE
jgi:uncharacterized protein (DUF433 family)